MSPDTASWTATAAAEPESYPAIGDYGVIGDCRTAALVSRCGSIEWLCLPHFSGTSVFAALLDRGRGGRFAVQPVTPFMARRRYLERSNILETTFSTADGMIRLTDLMPVTPGGNRLAPMREVLRIVVGVEGVVDVRITYQPRPDYGRIRPRLARRGNLGWACAWRDELLVLHTDIPLEADADRNAVVGTLRIAAGEKRYLSLCYTKGDVGVIAPLGRQADARCEATTAWWRNWSGSCTYHGPHREAVVRSALTLKLMTYALSGAVVAAPTTSLPEAIGGELNWDYRYCWLRDAALTMRAFTGLGYRDDAGAFLGWMLHATRLTWPELQVLYDVYGRTSLREEELGHLEGYKRSQPVRLGNGAHDQLQLDAYGAVVFAAFDYVQSGGTLARDEARLLAGFGRTVCRRWREPDNGIWEIRGPRRDYTFSKVMCWMALDCLIKLHKQGHLDIPVEAFRRERAAIAEAIESRGFSRKLSSYVGVFDGHAADASLLLMGCLGYKDPADPRMRGTYAHLQRRLGRNGLLRRYEAGYDALVPGEGAFGICSFWAVDNLARCGERDEAERCFAHVLSFANDLGLFAEEIDADTGALLGNFPQAFTHVGLINAALALARADRPEKF